PPPRAGGRRRRLDGRGDGLPIGRQEARRGAEPAPRRAGPPGRHAVAQPLRRPRAGAAPGGRCGGSREVGAHVPCCREKNRENLVFRPLSGKRPLKRRRILAGCASFPCLQKQGNNCAYQGMKFPCSVEKQGYFGRLRIAEFRRKTKSVWRPDSDCGGGIAASPTNPAITSAYCAFARSRLSASRRARASSVEMSSGQP